MKKIFMMACMATMLFSCANEDLLTKNEEVNVDQTYSLALRVNKASFTKGIQTPGTNASANITSMIIEVFDGNYNKLLSKDLSATEITAAINQTGNLENMERVVISGIDSRAAYVKVWAFQGAITSAALPVFGNSINSYQTDFASIPFYPVTGIKGNSTIDADGFISINKTEAPAPGPNSSENKIWTVESDLAPYFARFEVKPTTGITPKTTPNLPEDVNVFPVDTKIDITGIYINNINNKKDDTTLTLNKGNLNNWATGDWATNHPYTSDGLWSNMYNAFGDHKDAAPMSFASNADCYNLFAQVTSSPHVVVRVMVHLPEGSPLISVYGKDYYGFITLRDFNVAGGGKLSASGIQNGKLYKVALDLTVKPSDIAPDPESSLADLHAQVTIIDWEQVDLTPEL